MSKASTVARKFKVKRKRTKGSGAGSVHSINTIKLMAEALEFRLMGHTYEQIAEQLELSTSRAYQLVMEALDATLQEPADKVRAMELKRLDAMQVTFLPQAQQGDLRAADMILKIMERRARFTGADAPVKSEITGKDGKPIEHEIKIDAESARSALAEALAKAGVTGTVQPSSEQPQS